MTGGSSDWDGTTNAHLTVIQYTCKDGITRSYAECGDDGEWHYTSDRATVCHDDSIRITTPSPSFGIRGTETSLLGVLVVISVMLSLVAC